MSYSGWNSSSIQFAIENNWDFNFNLYNRNDLEQFCNILYYEYKGIRDRYNILCNQFGIKDTTPKYCFYCGALLKTDEELNQKICEKCLSL